MVLVMIPLHEPWRDEAQSWLIARDLDIQGILRQAASEGSPALWHLVLAPLAKLGLPYWTEHLAHSVFACATVALVLFASPFARWQKVAFAASYFMAFEYSVIARSYVMGVMFLLALAAFDRRRHERPVVYGLLIFGLANSNLHSFTIAAVLAVGFAFEIVRGQRSELRWATLLLMAAGGGLALWQLGDRAWAGYVAMPTDPALIIPSLQVAVNPARTTLSRDMTPALAFFAVVTWSLRRRWRPLVLLVVPVLGWALTPMVHVTQAPRHAGLIMMLVVFALWIAWESKPATGAAETGKAPDPTVPWGRPAASGGLAGLLVFGTLAVSAVDGISSLWSDARGTFSSSKAMASYLRSEGITDPIAAYRSPWGSSLLPYLPGLKLWYVDAGRWGTFIQWNRELLRSDLLSETELVARVRDEFGDDLPWLLVNNAIEEPERLGYRLQHASTELARVARGEERYFLYEPIVGSP